MTPQILVYHPNPKMGDAISAIARHRGLSPVVVNRVGAGFRLLHHQKFPGIILDFADEAIASDLVAICRHSKSNRSAVVLALADRQQIASECGAHFCVKRSPDLRELASALKAAQGMILREFRRYARVPMASCAMLDNDEHSLQLRTLNISEGGMCVQSEIPGWNRDHLVEFNQPEIGLQFQTRSTVVWTAEGKSGIKFHLSSTASRSALTEWLTAAL
jgi:hypothetical protein